MTGCATDLFFSELRRVSRSIVPEVLEVMFFTAVMECAEAKCAESQREVIVGFRGRHSGSFRFRVDDSLLFQLASGFLGIPSGPAGDEECSQVACELANMLCGSMLSRAESESGFELGSPRICSPGETGEPDYQATFLAECGGALEVAFLVHAVQE